jgi:hypothetical protein
MFDYTDDEDFSTPGVESQGQEWETRHDDMVQANAGYGQAEARQQVNGQYNPAAFPLAPLGRGLRGSPDGIGEYALLNQLPTPSATRNGVLGTIANGSPVIRGFRAISGLGADTVPAPGTPGMATAVVAPSALMVAFVGLALVATGVSGYYVGKALAPSSAKEGKYAWWGVAAALFGGPVGLGIEALVAEGHK